MTVTVKKNDEIEYMRTAGRLAAEVLEMIAPYVVVGVTTNELDRICHEYIVSEQHAIPAPLNYHGFPKSICTSGTAIMATPAKCSMWAIRQSKRNAWSKQLMTA